MLKFKLCNTPKNQTSTLKCYYVYTSYQCSFISKLKVMAIDAANKCDWKTHFNVVQLVEYDYQFYKQ